MAGRDSATAEAQSERALRPAGNAGWRRASAAAFTVALTTWAAVAAAPSAGPGAGPKTSASEDSDPEGESGLRHRDRGRADRRARRIRVELRAADGALPRAHRL